MGPIFSIFRGFNPMDHPRIFRLIMNNWPPLLGAAIVVQHIAEDWQRIRVDVLDEKGTQVARVTKTLYIRKKSSKAENNT